MIGEIRVCDRIDQPRQQVVGVGHDIAIVDGHDRAVLAGNQIAHRGPDVLAFARLCWCQTHRVQFRPKCQHTRTVVPDHDVVLVQPFEKRLGVAELRLIGAIKADDNPVQVFDLGQLRQNAGHRIGFQLRIEAGQDQRHLSGLCKSFQLIGHFITGARAQIMQCRDVTVLVKISHVMPSLR